MMETTPAPRTYTIHHFEDEPDTMSWIPDALLNHYWAEYPEWIVDDASYGVEPDRRATRFVLYPRPRERVEIVYRVYEQESDISRSFASPPKRGDIMLLDVMTIATDGSVAPLGLEIFKTAANILTPDSIYFVTGFPRELLDREKIDHRLPPGHILAKPVDVETLVRELVNKLGITNGHP